jgi:hypothetical protein
MEHGDYDLQMAISGEFHTGLASENSVESLRPPYRSGVRTRMTIRGWPRSGVSRAMRDFADFCAYTRLLARGADVPDDRWFWWKLRTASAWHGRESGLWARSRTLRTLPVWSRSRTA